MYTDLGLRLATAEALQLQNAGVLGTPTIGADSATLALDQSGVTTAIRAARDIGAGHRMSLAINVDVTPITAAGHDSTLEIQLISMPIAATVLDAATTEGFLHGIAAVVTTAATDIFTVVGHGLALGTPVWFSAVATTTGIVVDRVQYVIPISVDTFQVANTLALAIAGTQVVLTLNGTVDLEFIATIHASTGSLRLFDEIGGTVHGGMLVQGHRTHIPLKPLTAMTGQQSLSPGQTLAQPHGSSPGTTDDVNLIGATPQRFYYLNYLASVTITGGAVTVDLVLGSGEGDSLTYYPTGVEVIG